MAVLMPTILRSTLHHKARPLLTIAVFVSLLILPWVANATDHSFYTTFATRIMIFALAATSLNLVMGFGGMVAFGHASFLGIGAYTVGILMANGFSSAWLSWPAATLISGFIAYLIGLVALRTKGVYFIMSTLSFAQMLYFISISLTEFGGDDGMSLPRRSIIQFGPDLASDDRFFYVVLALCVGVLFCLHRLINGRFGRVLQSIRENEIRMSAIGYPVFRYKLVAFSISGALAGLAGALIANQNSFVSPSLMLWTQSGTLMIMIILGGVGYLYGGVLGSVVFLLLEEGLSSFTIHWQLPMGLILLCVVLFAPTGLVGLFRDRRRHD